MNKLLFALLTLSTSMAMAAGIEGKWKTIDDATGKPKGVVVIANNGGSYSGRIVELFPGVPNECAGCKGDKQGSPIVGMTVLTGLKADGDNAWSGGKIFDPKSGKTYKANAKLVKGGQALEVRGYVGVSALGRTQTWQRM